MHASYGWLLDAPTVTFLLAAWAAIVLAHAGWRSGGAAAPDPVRDSGPIL